MRNRTSAGFRPPLLLLAERLTLQGRCMSGHWEHLDGNFSALDTEQPVGRCEALVHEVAHGFLLGLKVGDISTMNVSEHLNLLEKRSEPWKQAYEWNEVRTQAVSIWVLRAMGFRITKEEIVYLCTGAENNMESYYFTEWENIRKEVLRLLPAKSTARVAWRVIDAMLGDKLHTNTW